MDSLLVFSPLTQPPPQISRSKANGDHFVYGATAPGERESGKLFIGRPAGLSWTGCCSCEPILRCGI